MALVSLSSRPIGGRKPAPLRLFFYHLLGGGNLHCGAGPPVIPTLISINQNQFLREQIRGTLVAETGYHENIR